jgi:hypothetical protein
MAFSKNALLTILLLSMKEHVDAFVAPSIRVSSVSQQISLSLDYFKEKTYNTSHHNATQKFIRRIPSLTSL